MLKKTRNDGVWDASLARATTGTRRCRVRALWEIT